MTTTSLSRFYEQALLPICVDTRCLRPGDLFFALPGSQVDGHAFLAEAFQKGAAAAVVSANFDRRGVEYPLIPVPDPLAALQLLAKNKMAKFPGKVIAITGSVGKTTTKEFLVALLSAKYRVSSTPGNYNSKIGLPLSLLNHVKEKDEIVVVEMGMSCAGEIAQLVSIVPPDVAILTAVALAHAAHFRSLEAIAAAKAEIFSHAKTRIALINQDSSHFAAVASLQVERQISFGPAGSGAAYVFSLQPSSLVLLQHGHAVAEMPLPRFLGQHNLSNLLAAMIAAFTMGLQWNEMPAVVENCTLPKKRLQVKPKNGITFIDDSYNATSLSMKAALDTLAEAPLQGKRIAVLGEMAELGAFAVQCHTEVALHALEKVDVAIYMGTAFHLAGAIWEDSGKKCFFASSHDEVVELLRDIAVPGDGVLLKGSNLANLGLIFDLLY